MIKYLILLLLPLTLFGQSQKISDMTSATSLTGSEYVPIVQTTNKKSTVTLLRGWASTIGTAGQLLKVNAGATALEFFTPSYLTALSNGNGTTANGSAADLGGAITGNQSFTWGGNYDIQWGDISSDNIEARFRRTSSINSGIRFYTKGNAGYIGALNLTTNGSSTGQAYFEVWDGSTAYYAGYTSTGYRIDLHGLGTNSTGDIYYRNSSGNLARLAAGTDGHVLTLAAGIPSWAASSGGGWALTGTSTLTGAVDIVGSTSNTLKHTFNSLGTTQTNGAGLWFTNTTAAAAGAQQISPSIVLEGRGWKTNATAASQSVKFAQYVLPVQGAANPTGTWTLNSSINGGAYGTAMTYTSAGLLTAPDLTLSGGTLTISSTRLILFNGGSGTIGADTNAGLAFRSNASSTVPTGGYYRFYNTNGSYTATSGTLNIMANETSFAPTSGTGIFNAYLGSGTFNQTGGANGIISMLKLTPTYTATGSDVNGLYYDPTVTSVGGVNYFLHATSGKTLIGGTTITSNTYFDFRGGSSTDKIWRLADGSNNELFTFKADKEYEVTQTNGKYQERQPTGTTSATVYSENIYSSSDISDGQSVTIEVLWTAKDSGANTGAGGVFYTTWTKASGTLAKAGDNQLVTNDNMSGSWALSTSDSSGSIALAFTGIGVANTEISLVTRIIKSN